MAKLPQQLQTMQRNAQLPQQVIRCDFCGGDHPNGHCHDSSEEIIYIGNQGRQNFFNNPSLILPIKGEEETMPNKGEDKSNDLQVVQIPHNNIHCCMNAQQTY